MAGEVVIAQEGGRAYRDGDRLRGRNQDRPPRQRVVVDCHRDVRTHRINGEWVTHRHVGDNCQVRIVNRSSEPAPGD